MGCRVRCSRRQRGRANWQFIATGQSYVHLFAAPSPVQHFWSLAVEEQFYHRASRSCCGWSCRRTRSPKVIGGVLGRRRAPVVGVDGGARRAWGEPRPPLLRHRHAHGGAARRCGARGVGVATTVSSSRRGRGRSWPLWAWRLRGDAVGVHERAARRPVCGTAGCWGSRCSRALVILGVLAGRGPLAAVLSWGPLPAIGSDHLWPVRVPLADLLVAHAAADGSVAMAAVRAARRGHVRGRDPVVPLRRAADPARRDPGPTRPRPLRARPGGRGRRGGRELRHRQPIRLRPPRRARSRQVGTAVERRPPPARGPTLGRRRGRVATRADRGL